eukprot:3784074-Prymnesium_polylepis.1
MPVCVCVPPSAGQVDRPGNSGAVQRRRDGAHRLLRHPRLHAARDCRLAQPAAQLGDCPVRLARRLLEPGRAPLRHAIRRGAVGSGATLPPAHCRISQLTRTLCPILARYMRDLYVRAAWQDMEVAQMMLTIQTNDVQFPVETWSEKSPLATKLVRQLLVRRPKGRLTATQVCEHPWLRGDATSSEPPPATRTTPAEPPLAVAGQPLPQVPAARTAQELVPVASTSTPPAQAAQLNDSVGEGSAVSTNPSDEAIS